MNKVLLDTDIFSNGRAAPMIAAIAIQYGLTLVTGNQTHFHRIISLGYELKLENWREV